MAHGKLDAKIEALSAGIAQSGFLELPIYIRHAIHTTTLPNIHRDPFDRLLLSQAMVEPLKFLTADCHLQAYSELVVLV